MTRALPDSFLQRASAALARVAAASRAFAPGAAAALKGLRGGNAARRGEIRLRAIIDTAAEGIITINERGLIQSFNAAAAAMFGIGQEEALGRNIKTLMPEPDASAHDSYLKNYLATGKRGVLGSGPREVTALNARGEPFAAEIVISELHQEGQRIFVGIVRDISARKARHRAYEQLVRSEKMAAIGQLAAGVAHQINNPMSFVSSNLHMLGQYTSRLIAMIDRSRQGANPAGRLACDGDLDSLRNEIFDVIAETRQGITRVTNVVRALVDLARPHEEAWERCDVNHCLEASIGLLPEPVKRGIAPVREYGQVPPIHGIASQLNQVFLNILANAAAAIAPDGSICIRTEGCGQGEVRVEITDDGCGIEERDLPRIFDPFFTTKSIGHGIGIGLFISRKIVDRHGGRIAVDSRRGSGTRVTVWLPAAGPDCASAADSSLPAAGAEEVACKERD